MGNEAQLQAMQALMQMSGEQRMELLKQFKTPVGKIAQSPMNGPQRSGGLAGWYELNPQARQGESYVEERTRQLNDLAGRSQMDQLTRGRDRAEVQAQTRGFQQQNQPPVAASPPAAVAAPQGGGGFMDFVSKLFGGGNQQTQAPTGPTMNSATGLPMGTQAGDPVWLDQQAANAPRAIPIPGEQPAPLGSTMDPAIQNLLGISMHQRNLQQGNPDWNSVPDPFGPPRAIPVPGAARVSPENPALEAANLNYPLISGQSNGAPMSDIPGVSLLDPNWQNRAMAQFPQTGAMPDVPKWMPPEPWQIPGSGKGEALPGLSLFDLSMIPPAGQLPAQLPQPSLANQNVFPVGRNFGSPRVGGMDIPQYNSVPRAQYGPDGKLIKKPTKTASNK